MRKSKIMSVRRLAIVAAVAVTAAASSSALAVQQTYTASFNGTSLDSGLSFYTNGAGYSLSVGGGFATINYSIPSSTNSVSENAGIQTNFRVTGDYVATVDVYGANLPTDSSTVVSNTSFGSGVGSNFTNVVLEKDAQYNVDTYTQTAAGSTSTALTPASSALTFQIARTGGTITESYATLGSTQFTTLRQFADPNLTGAANFYLGTFYQGTAGTTNSSVKFANLSITSNVPEPASWMAMIAGFGMVGAALRRQRGAVRSAAYQA